MKISSHPTDKKATFREENKHQSCFPHWDESSAVRSKPYNYDCSHVNSESGEPLSGNWFFPAALSFLKHPLLADLTSQQVQGLLARNLISFLEYTTLLEHRIVNRSAESIAHNYLPVTIPHDLRMDALRLYTDEAYHAVISADVSNQVAEIYGIDLGGRKFQRIARLEELIENSQHPELGWFLIGFVSETVITKEFLKIGQTAIAAPVYTMLMDHLEDERKHSQYFIKMFSYIWNRLAQEERDFCALQLPTIIQECFRLDSNILINDLTDVGVRKEIAKTLSMERNTKIENQKRARAGSVATLHALRKCNFFSDPRYAVEFARSGLLDQDATLFRG
ncbi:diiron oxygenase [Cupriavidus basilensis]|uniref:Diiron oxygenase n=1 Tax=Cupriavidus basilensis TaxID=68895 RepID=A0ABT6AT20_9BURK|nr:diiron oxygenase [Cupriavidus basilensis]MDF3835777.1 diiron oxygenase [Cupriavidus basilensis]